MIPELLAQLAWLALQMPVTLPGGNLWLSSQLCLPWLCGRALLPLEGPGAPLGSPRQANT